MIDTFGYRLMLLVHIFTVIVAFAPAFVWPVASARLRKSGRSPSAAWAMAEWGTPRVYGPALVIAGLFGFGLTGVSSANNVYSFGDPWISVAMLLWFVMLGVLFGLLMPAEKKAGAGDAAAVKMVPMFGGILHLLLAVMLIVMIWKPGFSPGG